MRRMLIAVQMTAGVVLVGAAGYIFLAVVGQVFEVPRYGAEVTALASLYLLVNVVGPGLFTAVEQETSRAVSTSLASGAGARAAALRSGAHALGLLVALWVVLLALWPAVLSRVLADRPGLLAALMVAGGGAALTYWVRGVLAAQQRYGAYALTLNLEGGVRLLGSAALVVVASRSADAYGAVFACASVVAGLTVLPVAGLGRAPATAGVREPAKSTLPSLLLLVAATLLAQALANLAPVVLTYRSPDDVVAAATFSATFVLARIPLFVFSPVQSLLLPSLTRAVTEGRFDDVRHRVRLVLLAVLAVGVPGAVLAVVLGPWAVTTLFGSATRPGSTTLLALGAATIVMMGLQVLQASLVALRAQREVAVAWAVGTVVFFGLLVTPVAPLQAALTAQLCGPVLVGLLMLRTMRARLQAGSPVAADDGAAPLPTPGP